MKSIRYNGESIPYPVYLNTKNLFLTVRKLAHALKEEYPNSLLGLVCRGSSGMCIATSLTFYSDKWRIIYIRKEGEERHAGSNVHVDRLDELDSIEDLTLIFVDDLVSSGDTLLACYDTLRDRYGRIMYFDAIALVERKSWLPALVKNVMENALICLPRVEFINVAVNEE